MRIRQSLWRSLVRSEIISAAPLAHLYQPIQRYLKSKFRMLLTAITFFAGLALLFAALALPLRLAAQDKQDPSRRLPHYHVIDIGTLGGSYGEGEGINNRGWVTGTAYLPGNTGKHRFLWQRGVKTDLGTLGGPNSGSYAFGGLNDRGQDVGHAETSSPDPLGEDFCGFGTHLICLPFLWQTGVMTPLPTFGGNNGRAAAINNQAWVVGEAENTTLDSTCSSPELQAEPAIWRNGTIQQLPSFPATRTDWRQRSTAAAWWSAGRATVLLATQILFTPCSGKTAR